MKLFFKQISCENFMSLQNMSLTLNDRGFITVRGINNNSSDNSSSNGSGKSVIFESIFWCLTGSTLRGNKTITSLFSTDGTKVELIFTVDNDEFKLIRTKDYKDIGTKLFIYINGEDKSGKGIRESEKLLNQYLPHLNTNLIGAVIILGQGLPYKFSNNSPSGRKDILEQLSNSDFMIVDLKNRVQNRQSQLNKKNRELSDLNIQKLTEKKMIEQSLQEKINELNNLPNIDTLDVELKNINQNLITNQTMYNNYSQENEQNVNEYKKLFDKIIEIKNKYEKEMFDVRLLQKSETVELNSQITIENIKIKQCNEKIKEIQNIKEFCPTCGQKLQGVEKPDTTEYVNSITASEKSKIELNDKLNSINTVYSNKLNKLETDCSNETLKINDTLTFYKETIDQTSNLLQKLDNDIKNITKRQLELETIINNHNQNKQKLENDITALTNNLQSVENLLYKNNNDIDDVSNRLTIVNKFISILSRDFRGYLLQNVVNYINEQFKTYSKLLFNEANVEFALNSNNIDIMFSGKDYDSLSGGEKQKIDLIIQFSIRDMLCKFLNFSSNILVLDEMFDNLDDKSSENVLNLIINKLNDISSVFIITHHNSIPIPYDNEITVIKGEDGISRIT